MGEVDLSMFLERARQHHLGEKSRIAVTIRRPSPPQEGSLTAMQQISLVMKFPATRYQSRSSTLRPVHPLLKVRFHPLWGLPWLSELLQPLIRTDVRCELVTHSLSGVAMLTDPRLHSFLALCKHGTTTAAAAATNRALSTISTHVSAIEGRVGAALFKRAHGVFTLTELGEEVRTHAETIVAAEEAILATARLIKQRRQTVATTRTSAHGPRTTGRLPPSTRSHSPRPTPERSAPASHIPGGGPTVS